MEGPVSRQRPLLGWVASFDPDRGLGTVRAADGFDLPFHCTAIADGTRQIAVDTAVAFLVAPGHLGRLEARGLVPTGGSRSASQQHAGGNADDEHGEEPPVADQ